ncbi:MAG: N-acetylmuramoyl-L-alanine amidase [Pseudomonadota bacterium]
MAKQTVLICVLMIALTALAGPLPDNTPIQTTQKTIAIDPGHGGEDFGLVSSMGLKEKTIVLQLAQKTALLLEDRYNVLLTRSRDITMMPDERMAIANQNQADLFVTIHLNASHQSLAFGYYFDTPDPVLSLPDIQDTRWESLPLHHLSQSKAAGNAFLSVFSSQKKSIRFLLTGAPIRLLEGTLMPAVLVEPLSISMLPQDQNDREKILDQYAVLISKSIDLYFNKSQDN